VPWAWRSGARWVDGARLVVSGAGAAMVLYHVYVELFRIGPSACGVRPCMSRPCASSGWSWRGGPPRPSLPRPVP